MACFPRKTQAELEDIIRTVNDGFLPTQGFERVDVATLGQDKDDAGGYAFIDSVEKKPELGLKEALELLKLEEKQYYYEEKSKSNSGADALEALRVVGSEISGSLGVKPPPIYGIIAENLDTAGHYGVFMKNDKNDEVLIGVAIYEFLEPRYLKQSRLNDAKRPPCFERVSPARMVFSLAHELYHNFQNEKGNLFAHHEQKQNPEWTNDYITEAADRDMYHAQPLELDANVYALETVKRYGFRIPEIERTEFNHVVYQAKKLRPEYDRFIKEHKSGNVESGKSFAE